jgi:hypothetical protein
VASLRREPFPATIAHSSDDADDAKSRFQKATKGFIARLRATDLQLPSLVRIAPKSFEVSRMSNRVFVAARATKRCAPNLSSMSVSNVGNVFNGLIALAVNTDIARRNAQVKRNRTRSI